MPLARIWQYNSIMLRLLLLFLMLVACSAHAVDELDVLKEAAEQGIAQAQYGLGVLYSLGVAVPKDDVQAYAWLTVAAAQGNEHARELKETLARDMTRTAIDKAEKLSHEYRKAYGLARRMK